MAFAFSSLLDAIYPARNVGEKIDCYHCGEKMRKMKALTVKFNGLTYPVCCHGCLAVLRTVEQNGLTAQYLQAKVEQPASGS